MKRTVLLSSLFWALGCGAGHAGFDQAFTKKWQSDSGDSASTLYERFKSAPLDAGSEVAVGVTDRGLVGKVLGGGNVWNYPGKVETVPEVSGDVVAFSSGSQLVALKASSGSELWKVDTGPRRLRGIGDDGGVTVVSLDDARGTESSVVMIVARDGSIKYRYELKSPVGVPAIGAGIAFVPWDSQYVSGIDVKTGDEVGRILLRHQVSQVRNVGGELYFGQIGFTRFDEKIGAAQRRDADYVQLPSRILPGKPSWYSDGTEVRVPSDSATTKIQLLARPSMRGNELGIAADTYVATYFSLALGLNAKDASLEWVRGLTHDIVGGAASANGFVFCDEAGKLWSTGSTGGAPAELGDLGSKLIACTVQANQTAESAAAPEPLAQQVQKVFENNLPSLASAYAFIVEELPKIEDPLVTKILIDLIENPRTVPSIAKRARQLLSGQRIGEQYMLAALKRHYDFLSGNRPPPVGPLADALAALGSKQAAPLLAKQLNDPANEAGDTQKVAKALHELAGASELDELKTFFALYRATAAEPNLAGAVILVAETMIRVGGEDGRALVKQAAFDPLTQQSIRSGLNKALRPPPGAKAVPKVSRKPPKVAPNAQAEAE